jgi:MFS family permease
MRAALSSRNFARYIAGNSVSLVGTWVQRTAVGWLAWELTHSPAWVGFVAFADLATTILIGPIGGVLADRMSRRQIMMVTQSLLSVVALLMAILVALEAVDVLGLAALVALSGAIVGLNQPARLALIPSLVPRPSLPTAVALNSIIFNLARFVGPAVASGIIAAFGMSSAFFFNAASYFAFILSLVLIDPDDRPSNGQSRGWRSEIMEGFFHVARHVALGPLLLSFVVASIFIRPLPELLPALAAQAFQGDIHTLALLSSTLGVGAMLGGVWVAGAPQEGLLARCFLAMAVTAASVFAVSLSPSLPIVLPAIAATGFFLVSAGVTAQTVLQLHVPTALRGRIMSLFGLVFRGGPAVGALVLGLLAEQVGLRLTLALGAISFAVYWLWVWTRVGQMTAALRGQALDD